MPIPDHARLALIVPSTAVDDTVDTSQCQSATPDFSIPHFVNRWSWSEAGKREPTDALIL